MGKIYDISKKIDSSRSTVKIDDDHIYTINASRATGVALTNLDKNKDLNEFDKIDKIIKIALGDKALEEISSLDLDIPNYTPIVNSIMAALNGKDIEEIEKLSEEAENKSKKK